METETKRMKEKWNKWIPENNIPDGEYELISLQQNWDNVKLVFDDEKYNVEVIYNEEILAFRSCDEGDRWNTIDKVLGDYGKEFLKGWLFYKVENSDFKKWFVNETLGVRKESEFEHHVFVTANDVVDVLALKEPMVKICKLQEKSNY